MPPRRRRWLLRMALVLLAAFLGAAAWLIWPFWQLSGQFQDQPELQPSRLYGRSTRLEVGRSADMEGLVVELEDLGYRAAVGEEPLPEGRFERSGSRLNVHMRSFLTPSGRTSSALLEVELIGRRIESLGWGGRRAALVLLEPPLLASYYGPERKERRPVTVQEVPKDLIDAVLAVEDSGFFRHPGLSPTGIVRAAWVNVTDGEVRQGGSTLTQQLAKNLYLTHERTWSRKLREAVLAVILELRYDKWDILQAYLNEIYLGSDHNVNVIGVGAAARTYFGKDAAHLDLAEAAALAGMIRAPGNYNPITHPQRARERRDLVLERLRELGWVEPALVEAALARPLGAVGPASNPPHARYFATLAEAEVRRRFGILDLADGGYSLLSTLEGTAQREAESAVAWGLESLEKGWEKGHKGGEPLQAALVSIDPHDGGIRAYVGGRSFAASQFDRASQARRQAGSAFKPVVYATAFEARLAAPSTLVDDSPLEVVRAGRTWSPQNDDRLYQGDITVRAALEGSRNVPTARLALEVGLPRIVETARSMGVTAPLEPLPSLALGAFEVTPLEMATVYGTLAGGGSRPAVHSIDAVFSRGGRRVQGKPLPEPQPVLSPQSAYLLTSVLQGVFERGTASRAREDGLSGPLAGKTGTSNDRRDSWFAGYSSDRVSVVWVGYDDNSETRLSGSRAALPIWARFTQGVRPAGGFGAFAPPPGIVSATIDPATGMLATERCPRVLTEMFLEGGEPRGLCPEHSGWWQRRQWLRDQRRGREPHPFREWLGRLGRRRGPS